MYRVFQKTSILFLYSILTILYFCPQAFAQSEEEMKILRMYYKEDELVVTPTRHPKPLSQVAENITVITYKEIEQMNAHTVADVLNTIPGIQMDIRGGPGSVGNTLIQGSEFRHVRVVIDGVTVNNLSDSYADISSIPVQHIERIEIIKGPASSSWGSSLGGIINIITKSPDESRKIGGTLSASYGERNTGDYRAEASGRISNFGYYIYGGNLISDGFRPTTNFYENNFYTKLKWDPTERLSLIFTLGYNKGHRGFGEFPQFDFSQRHNFEYLFSTLSLNYGLSDEADLTISFRTSRQNSEIFIDQLSTGAELGVNTADEKSNGASARFTWRRGVHTLVMGGEFDDGELKANIFKDGKQKIEKWAFFANDTIVINKFSFTPGIRYDHTSTNGEFLSPSLGVTYKIGEKTIIRGYVARGFNIPPLAFTFWENLFFKPNPDLKVEKVWSVQAGIETTSFNYFWLKTTLFRHQVSDAIDTELRPDGFLTSVNKGKQKKQGLEVEIKTIPVYNSSLFAGFVFMDAKDRDTGETILNIPRYTYDIGIQYNDNKSLNASLRGHYIWWNADPSFNGKYSSFIWDLNLIKKVYTSDRRAVELFLTAHNIFNGSQYLTDLFQNPKRWIEGGMRLKF
jgi:vitamin B12 transporter